MIMIKDEDGIIPDSEYDPAKPEHNPTEYMRAMYDAEKEVKQAAKEARYRMVKEQAKDKPGEFAGLSYFYWFIILAMCAFFAWALAH
jgi:hypothetical protein